MGQIVGGSTVTLLGARTRYLQSFFASGVFTVPDGVTTLIVTCIGGGGGGGCLSNSNPGQPTAGGLTTFSSVSVGGGAAGISSSMSPIGPGPKGLTGITHSQGLGRGGGGGSLMVGVNSGTGGGGVAVQGGDGQVSSGTLTGLTPGSTITYTVGSYGFAGIPVTSGVSWYAYGGSGSSGRIDVEWWA